MVGRAPAQHQEELEKRFERKLLFKSREIYLKFNKGPEKSHLRGQPGVIELWQQMCRWSNEAQKSSITFPSHTAKNWTAGVLCAGVNGTVALGPDPSEPGGHKSRPAALEAGLFPQREGAEPPGHE